MKKERLDVELVRRGLAPSREKAQAMIMAGEVIIGDRRDMKASAAVTSETGIIIRRRYPYVSRGGWKIARAVETFGVDPSGCRILDLGISNGGFSDYLLQKGACSITGVDVNTRQVDRKLREDPRVRLVEKNARYLEPADLPEEPDIIVMDLSFISILKVLPAIAFISRFLLLALVKPQFEARKEEVGRGGVIRSEELRRRVLQRVKEGIHDLGMTVSGVTEAGVKGRKGNQEYFFKVEGGRRSR